MSFKQFMCAYTTMLQDHTLVAAEDRAHMMAHLQQVCQDAQERPWPAVLKWSNYVFDRLERGELTWQDKEDIQLARVRIAISAQSEAPVEQSVLCPAYNSGYCRSTTDTHKDGNTTFTHQSAYCEAVAGIIVVMGHSHYGPVVMVHMVVIMVHLGKSLWSTWVSRYGPPKKSLWSTIRNIRNNVEMGSKL